MANVRPKISHFSQRRRVPFNKDQSKKEPVDWAKVTAGSLNVLLQFKKLFADPKHCRVGRMHSKCPRKGCGGTIWASVAGPKKHLRFACTNTSREQGGTGECYIQGME